MSNFECSSVSYEKSDVFPPVETVFDICRVSNATQSDSEPEPDPDVLLEAAQSSCPPEDDNHRGQKSSSLGTKLSLKVDMLHNTSKLLLYTIIQVHRVCIVNEGVKYPETLQNILLTTGRTIDSIASLLHEASTEDSTFVDRQLDLLTVDIAKCQLVCKQVVKSCPTRPEAGTQWETYLSTSQRAIHDVITPLLALHKHLKCDTNCKLFNFDHSFEYVGFKRRSLYGDDAATEDDDDKSAFSETTLLGIQDEKSKVYENEKTILRSDNSSLVKPEEPNGCFSGLFRGVWPAKQNAPNDGETSQSEKSALVSKLTPRRLKEWKFAREAKRLSKLCMAIDNAISTGTLPSQMRLLKNSKANVVLDSPTRLNLAISSRRMDMLKFLLAHGTSLQDLKLMQITPFQQAVLVSDPEMCLEMCRLLVEAGASVDDRLTFPAEVAGQSLLMYAINEGKTELVKYLIKAGADLEAQDHDGKRAMHHAADNKSTNISILPILIKAGANILAADNLLMNTPLHYAAKTGNLGAIELLLEAGALVDQRNIKLSTPLHMAIKYHHNAIAELLLQNGTDPEAPRLHLETPLKFAVGNHNKVMVDILLKQKGAKIEAVTSEGRVALHTAAAYGSPDMVRQLLDAGADVNVRSKYGATPLYIACQNGRLLNVMILLEAGADPSLGRQGFGCTRVKSPSSIARHNRNFEAVQLLKCWENGIRYTPSKELDDGADDHICSRAHWFDKYVVRVHENDDFPTL